MTTPKELREPPVGTDEPRTPEHSLPSYKEPTAETNRRLTREEEAELALKRTAVTRWTPAVLIALFLATIASVPLIQMVAEIRGPHPRGWLPMFDVLKTLPTAAKIRSVRSLGELTHILPRAGEIKAAEKELETQSVVSQWLLPPAQTFLSGILRAGTEQVYPGRDGWLFYRRDVDYVTGLPFLEPAQMRHRAHLAGVQPDPVRAIVAFRDQLAARGIDLVILPVPVKASVQGEMLSTRVSPNELLENASFAEFKSKLAGAGVRVFDPAPLLMARKPQPLYLQTDTHWRPETMQFVAEALAASLKLPPVASSAAWQVSAKEIQGVGDVARMLKLTKEDEPQRVTIRQVTSGLGFWRPTPDADVLLLGDSFANIFSLEALGWGESAGFAEQLSVALGGRPLDRLLRNSDGAFATREMLANELARGHDRLAGKKLVIWEFAARELAFGNWKLLDLKLGQAAPARVFALQPGESVEATGTVEAISSVPRPGTVPYRDHVMAVQLTDLTIPSRPASSGLQAIVYLLSMQDDVWTAPARLRPGDRIKVRLRAWADVSGQYEQINRSELDDPALQLEEPVWGELQPAP